MAETCVKRRISADKHVKGARAGVPGLTFKEDVPDIRNTRVVDIIAELKEYGIIPGVTDKEFYTNSFHIPVDYPIAAYDKIRLEGA